MFTDALRGGWRPNEESFFSAIITLEADAGGAKYTVAMLHENAEDHRKHLDMGFVDGWGKCCEQFEGWLSGLMRSRWGVHGKHAGTPKRFW